jgi:hypothetical protein
MRLRLSLAALLLIAVPSMTSAQTSICDTSYQNCRVPIIDRINSEMVAIDVFVWFVEDSRYAVALNNARSRGVRVRVIANNRWSSGARKAFLDQLRYYKIPSRVPSSTPSHIKAMVFAGQNEVVHTGGNFSSAMKPDTPYVNYIDEIVMFSKDLGLVASFKTIFEDLWTSTTLVNYSGTISLTRHYPRVAIDARVNYARSDMVAALKREAAALDSENVGIDIIMYRLMDPYTRDAILRALARNVPVRVLSDHEQYLDYAGMKAYVDTIQRAGAVIRWRVHDGMTHQKTTILRGNGYVILQSNNYDTWKASTLAVSEASIFDDTVAHFDRKWNSPTEFR